MGEPDSTQDDPIRMIALAALHPNMLVPTAMLRRSGLHREVLRGFYSAFEPEIKNLTGWKKLSDYNYQARWREVTSQDVKRGTALTQQWIDELLKLELSDSRGILIYDGEARPVPAKDYRLYLLRDGSLVYYAGGFHAGAIKPPVHGNILAVLDALDARYPGTYGSNTEEPFIVMMNAFCRALETSISQRKRQVADQEALNERLSGTIKAVLGK